MNTLRHLWLNHKLLLTGFVLALLATLVLCARLVTLTIYFAHHRDVELADWMPLGYISRSYEIPPDQLAAALHLPPGAPFHVPLERISEHEGIPLPEIKRQILDAVRQIRAGK